MHGSGIVLTEASFIEAIRQLGAIIVAVLLGGFGVNGFISHRARKSAAAAHKELIPNHGSSQRDAVNRLEKKVDDAVTTLAVVAHRQTEAAIQQHEFAATQNELVKKHDELSAADEKLNIRLDSHIEQSERILGALIRKETE